MKILFLIFATLLLFSMTIRAQENNKESTTLISSTPEELKIKQIESYCEKRSERECKEEKDENCKELHKNTCIVIETKWIQKIEQECACSSIECDEEGKDRKCKNRIKRCEKGCIKNACKLRANNECNGESKCVKMSRKGCLSAHLPKRKHGNGKHGNGKHHGQHNAHHNTENQHNEGKTTELTIPSLPLTQSQSNSPKQKNNRELKGIRRMCKRLSKKQCTKKDKECIRANTKSCEEKELQWKQNILTQCACETKTCDSEEPEICERRKIKCQRRCVRKACSDRSLEECKDDTSKKCAKRANRTCRRAHRIRRSRNQHKAQLDKKIRPNKQKNDKSQQRIRGIVRWCKRRARRVCKDDRDCNIAKRKACEESEVQWKSDELTKCACKDNSKEDSIDHKPSSNDNANDKANDLFNEDNGNIIINKSTRSNKSHHKHHNKGKGKGKGRKVSKCARKCIKRACKTRAQSSDECTSSSASPSQIKKCTRRFKKGCRRAHLGHRGGRRHHQKKNKFLHKYKNSHSASLKSGKLAKKSLPDEFSGIRKFCRRSSNKQCKKKDEACVDAKIKVCEEIEMKWRQNALTQCACDSETCDSSDPDVCARRTLKCQKRCLKKSCKSRAFDQCRNDQSSDDCVKKITRSCRRAHVPRRFNRHLKSFIGSMMKNILLNGVN